MEGDSFSDPRRRSARRGRGGRGGARGTTRGGRGSLRGSKRGGRGSSAPHRGRGTSKAHATSRRKLEDLGSNAYGYREPEQVEEDEFESGIDIEEAALSSMADDPYADTYKLDEDAVHALFAVDLGGMEAALQSVPLWVTLGEGSRFTLGIAEEDVVENYLEPFDHPKGESGGKQGVNATVGDFSDALAGLNFDSDDEVVTEKASRGCDTGGPIEEVRLESGVAALKLDASRDTPEPSKPLSKEASDMTLNAKATSASAHEDKPQDSVAIDSVSDEADDFDKWLDDV